MLLYFVCLDDTVISLLVFFEDKSANIIFKFSRIAFSFEHSGSIWQWVIKGAIDVDIGANPSAEGGEDEGVDDTTVKVVDIVDTFRLQVNFFFSIPS